MPTIRQNLQTFRQLAGWLILLFSIASCQSLQEAESIEPTAAVATAVAITSTSTAPATNVAASPVAATATLIPTVTTPPNLTPIPSPTFDAAPCIPHEPADQPASIAPLQIEYTTGTETFRWSEATGETGPVDRWAPFAALPVEALSPIMSPDESKLVYGEQISQASFGLYLLPAGAATATFLTEFSAPEVLARNEWAGWLELRLAWFEGSDSFTYHAEPAADGLGDSPYEELYLYDLNTAASTLLLPAIQAQGFVVDAAFTQLMAPVPGALHLVDLASGEHEIIDLPIRDFYAPYIQLSPDEHYLLLAGESGVILFDRSDNSFRTVALPFPSIGIGHGSIYPPAAWSADGATIHLLIPEYEGDATHLGNNEVFEFSAAFSYWQLDVAAASATKIDTVSGFLLSAAFAPDLSHFVWWQQDSSNWRWLYLYDIRSGTVQLYTEGAELEFRHWAPDSHHFLYGAFRSDTIWLGAPCESPITVGPFPGETYTEWIDSRRFLLLSAACAAGSSLTIHNVDQPQTGQAIPTPAGACLQAIRIVRP